MNGYEAALQRAADKGYKVIEHCKFQSNSDGLVCGRIIGLSDKLETQSQKLCVLTEELAHTEISISDITDPAHQPNRHEELLARRRSHDMLIGIPGLISAIEAGCQSRYEAAEFLGVTEEFLQAAVDQYKARHGIWVAINKTDYLCLEPLGVFRGMG